MTNHEHGSSQEQLSEAELLEFLKQSGTCLPALEGSIEGSTTGHDIIVAGYPIPIKDLLDPDMATLLAAVEQAKTGRLTLKMQPGWRYGFDAGDPSFRISRRNQGHVLVSDDKPLLARLVCVSLGVIDGEMVGAHFLMLDQE